MFDSRTVNVAIDFYFQNMLKDSSVRVNPLKDLITMILTFSKKNN